VESAVSGRVIGIQVENNTDEDHEEINTDTGITTDEENDNNNGGLDANNENMNVAQSNPPIKSAVSDSSKDVFYYVHSHIHKIESLLHKEMNVSTIDEILKMDVNKKKRIRVVEELARRLARRLRDDYELFRDRHQDFESQM
jgi:hypothetical protein